MIHRDEYRDAAACHALAAGIARLATRPWRIMEVCGGQTHAILRHGIDALLPPGVELLHGPGCPVCVTPAAYVDQAIALALRPGTLLCTFGDMLRVPGTDADLNEARARGGAVKLVVSPLDALAQARANPGLEVVFFAVGFETTAPANALAAHLAKRDGVANFSLLACHVLVPPALRALLAAPGCRVDGFLAAGHVCTIMGTAEYAPIAAEYRVPVVVTGFEPLDLLAGIRACVAALEAGEAPVLNRYPRGVRDGGNPAAQALLAEVFQPADRAWRGLGVLPASGLVLRDAYAAQDAERRFGAVGADAAPSGPCIAGAVLRGERKPPDCPAFGTACTPAHPLGVTMVSAEGTGAAYHRHGRAAA